MTDAFCNDSFDQQYPPDGPMPSGFIRRTDQFRHGRGSRSPRPVDSRLDALLDGDLSAIELSEMLEEVASDRVLVEQLRTDRQWIDELRRPQTLPAGASGVVDAVLARVTGNDYSGIPVADSSTDSRLSLSDTGTLPVLRPRHAMSMRLLHCVWARRGRVAAVLALAFVGGMGMRWMQSGTVNSSHELSTVDQMGRVFETLPNQVEPFYRVQHFLMGATDVMAVKLASDEAPASLPAGNKAVTHQRTNQPPAIAAVDRRPDSAAPGRKLSDPVFSGLDGPVNTPDQADLGDHKTVMPQVDPTLADPPLDTDGSSPPSATDQHRPGSITDHPSPFTSQQVTKTIHIQPVKPDVNNLTNGYHRPG